MAKKAAPAETRAPAKRLAAKRIRSWQDDPGSPTGALQPVQSSVPDLGAGSLPAAIQGPAVAAGLYDPATAEFRYWAAAEAIRRGTSLWSAALPPGTTWHGTNGRRLPIHLDDGDDFNAYYDRYGLHFFHGTSAGRVVFSGESPDILCHELGHAVLDALKPQLWGASFVECAAFHESFGDISALLSALALLSVREAALTETGGRLYRSSRLSRLAEQLGWAIRQFRPDVVDPDCLRNAVNSFFYRDPAQLPPSGPASALSSEPHSFSRVFTAAFLEALAAMHGQQPDPGPAGLAQAANDATTLLIGSVMTCPVVPSFFSQVAAHVLAADAVRFDGRYTPALKSAFVAHGILSLDSANAVAAAPTGAPPHRAISGTGAGDEPLIALGGHRFGLDEDLLVCAPAQMKRFSVAGAGPDVASVDPPAHDRAARSFVEDLFRRGKVDLSVDEASPAGRPVRPPSKLSHVVRRRPEGLVLERRLFDCGFAVHGR